VGRHDGQTEVVFPPRRHRIPCSALVVVEARDSSLGVVVAWAVVVVDVAVAAVVE